MLLACDPAVVGVSTEDAAMARNAVAAAEAAMQREAETKAAAAEAKSMAKDAKYSSSRSAAAAAHARTANGKDKDAKVKEEELKVEGVVAVAVVTSAAAAKRGDGKNDATNKDAVAIKGKSDEAMESNGAEGEKEKDIASVDADQAAAAAATCTAPIPPALQALVSELLPRLMHCCFKKSWQATVGGVAGIDALSRVLPVSALRAHLARILQALLRALRSLPPHAVAEVRAATAVFHRVLGAATPRGVAIRGPEAPPGVETAVGVLAEELFSTSSSPTVRPVVEEAIDGLSRRSGLDAGRVLDVKATHLSGLLSRPLHSRHVHVQTQVVHILNFCLSTSPQPLIKIHSTFVGLLQEALAVAESDDPSTLKGGPGASDDLHALRTVCIRLMCSAMACPELKTPPASQEQLVQLRQRIITMFFKSLTSRAVDVVQIAKEGLKRVIQLQSLSKELLQSSLRPILVNLAHYKNLTMPLLVGLERLLELLSNWFNPTLGEKLLEHLRRWLEPEIKAAAVGGGQQAQARPPPKDFKIAAAMINLFHLLPQAAGKFLEPLVQLTIQLEVVLPQSGIHSELNSLYRKPLAKFLSRYAADTVDFFLARLAQPAYFFRLLDMIRMETEGENIRRELAASAAKIIAAAFVWPRPGAGANPAADAEAMEGLSGIGGGSDLTAYNGLKLVTVLIKSMPEWLHTQPELVAVLWARWRSDARVARLKGEEMLALPELLESKRLAKCFINVASRDRSQVSYLFDILSVFGTRTRVNFGFVEAFYTGEVAAKYSPAERHAVLMHFLACFKQRSLSAPELVSALQLVVLPMLEHTLREVATDPVKMTEAKLVVTEEAVRCIVVDLLETADDESSPAHSETLRIQLLRMGTLLIQNIPDELVRHRKELIKFGWNHLKSEDSGSKQWAFVNVCHFLEAYQAPEKIVLQVFVALLRACQPEAKELVRQALGALTPALPKRLPQGDHKYPIWIRYTKKILVEEGHSLPHLIHVWNLIVQHESHFYPSRAQFVPQMVNSLSRLGLPSSSPPENRVLSISLVELILQWETQRKKRTAAAAAASLLAASSNGAVHPPAPAPVIREGSKRNRDSVGGAGDAPAKRAKGVDGEAVPVSGDEGDKDDAEGATARGKEKEIDEVVMPGSAEKGVGDAGMTSADDIAGAMDGDDKDKATGSRSDAAVGTHPYT